MDEQEEVDHILGQLFELQSRARIISYLNSGWITAEMANDLVDLFDEASL